jgi:hypothetical protein
MYQHIRQYAAVDGQEGYTDSRVLQSISCFRKRGCCSPALHWQKYLHQAGASHLRAALLQERCVMMLSCSCTAGERPVFLLSDSG